MKFYTLLLIALAAGTAAGQEDPFNGQVCYADSGACPQCVRTSADGTTATESIMSFGGVCVCKADDSATSVSTIEDAGEVRIDGETVALASLPACTAEFFSPSSSAAGNSLVVAAVAIAGMAATVTLL